MTRQKIPQRTLILALLLGGLSPAMARPGSADRLPSEVGRSVIHWWRAEGRSGRPKTRVQLASAAGRRFLQVTIDEPDYRGATGNETYFLYLRERSRWRPLFSAIGLGYFARRGGPGGRPWVETYAHNSAAVASYDLWGWDSRKRAYAIWKDWEGPYPVAMRFVLPPGGLPRSTRNAPHSRAAR